MSDVVTPISGVSSRTQFVSKFIKENCIGAALFFRGRKLFRPPCSVQNLDSFFMKEFDVCLFYV